MGVCVLLIDDEPDADELFRQNFRREIKKGELKIVFASTGEEALHFLRDEDVAIPSVVFSDIKMPGISGIELLEQIKPRWPSLPVFMISAFGGSEVETTVKELGAEGFFSKPVDFSNLAEMLKRRFGKAGS